MGGASAAKAADELAMSIVAHRLSSARRGESRQLFMLFASLYAGCGTCIRVTTDDSRPAAADTTSRKTRGAIMQIAGLVRDEVEEMFDRIDENGDRSISFAEYARLMREMNHDKHDAELRAGFDVIDTDRDGRVSFEEFQAWVVR
jgi:hypothetical protein